MSSHHSQPLNLEYLSSVENRRAISVLKRQKTIWKLITSLNSLVRIEEFISMGNPKPISHIIKIINQKIEQQGIILEENLTNSLEQIRHFVDKSQSLEGGAEVLWDSLTQIIDDPNIKYELKQIACVIYCENYKNRLYLEKRIIKNGLGVIPELSAIIIFYYSETSILEFVERNILEPVFSPLLIQNINFHLISSGFEQLGNELLRTYLLDFEERRVVQIAIPINELEDVIEIADYFDEKTLSKKLSNILAEKIEYEKLINRINLRNHGLDPLLEIKSYTSLPLIVESGLLDGQDFFEDLVYAFDIHNSDKKTAQEILRKFVNKIDNESLEYFSLDTQFDWLLNPIDIAKLLLNLDMVREAVNFLETFEIVNVPVAGISRFKANVFHKYGHHKKAVKNYFDVYVIGDLTRNEKKQFAKSLEYVKDWENAFIVENSINAINSEDVLKTARLAFLAKNKQYFADIADQKDNKLSKTDHAILQAFAKVVADDIQSSIVVLQGLVEKKKLKPYQFSCIETILNTLKTKSLFDGFFNLREENTDASTQEYLLILKLTLNMGEIKRARTFASKIPVDLFMDDQSTAEELVSVLIDIDNYENLSQIIDLFFSKWPLSIYLGEVKIKQFLEDCKFHSAQKLTRELLSIEDNWTLGMYLFGLSALNSKPSEFPYSDPSLIANPHIREEAIRNFSNWQSIKNNTLFQIMHIELDNNNKLVNYEKLLASSSNFESEHHWRLLLGISLAAIDNKKFDMAIKYLLELQKESSNFRIARKIIIEAFAKLHLPSEAIEFLSEDFETNDVSVEDLLSYSEKLHVYQEYFEFLETRYRESSLAKFKIAIAWCHLLSENYHDAESALNISEQSENCQGIEMLCIADIYQRINSPQNSKRILTNYLSTQKSMQTRDVIFAASLFSRLGEIEKALNLINLGDQNNQLINWIKIILSKKLGEINTADELLDKYFSKFSDPFHISDLRNYLRFGLNEDWIPTTKVISEVLLDVKTQSGNLASCFEILKVYVRSEMDPRIFLSAYMPLAQILGEKVEIPHEIKSDDPLVGHAVLQTSEVKGAEILASSDETKNELIRLALQSRLLIRNLNVLEGRRIYQEIKELLFVENDGSVKSPKFRSLIEKYYLIQTALENGDFIAALSISKSALEQKQIYLGFAEQYLKALAASLTINRIYRHIKVNQRLIPIEENDSMLDELASVFQEEEGKENLIGNSRRSRSGDEKILNKDISQILANTQFSYLADVNKALLLAQESLEEARQLLLELIEKGEDFPEVHIALALINCEMKDFSGAYSAVSIAIDHWPDEYQWQVFAGNICEKMGNYHLAAKHYVEAQTINSEIEDLENLHKKVQNENALHNISKLITKGEELISQGLFKKAEAFVDEIVSNNSESAHIFTLSGKISLNVGDLDKAIDSFLRALALAPFDKGIYFLLANAFESKRDFNSAVEILKDGAKILVNDFELNQKAGLLMHKYGKILDAYPFLKRALDIDPENHELRRLVDLLLNNNSDLGKYIYPVALVEK